jgi:hypothetical protein
MTPQEEKYVIATQEQILNTVLNLHAESRATKELLILIGKSSLKFPAGHSPESYWQACFDKAFEQLKNQSKDALLKQLK